VNRRVPIVYREFYDVPRMMVVNRGDLKLLLNCEFHESLGEYSNSYKVYVLPRDIENHAMVSWISLPGLAVKYLGDIPVEQVVFDATKRAEIDTEVLDKLVLDKLNS
jgi:hypothetical protein